MPVFDRESFMDKLGIVSYSLNPIESVKTVRAANGQTWRAGSGVRLWQGSIVCRDHGFDHQRRIEAMLINMQNPGNYFLFTPKKAARPMTPGPVGMPIVDGGQVAGFNLKLAGLTRGFKLSCGDYLSFVNSGAHRLYQITEDATANPSGAATVKLNILMMSGNLPSHGTSVRLINPQMTCEIIPGTVNYGNVGLDRQTGVSFRFVQTVRVS